MFLFLFQTFQPAPKPDILNEKGAKTHLVPSDFCCSQSPVENVSPILQEPFISGPGRARMTGPPIGILREAFIRNYMFQNPLGAIWRGLILVFCVKHSSAIKLFRDWHGGGGMARLEIGVQHETFINTTC